MKPKIVFLFSGQGSHYRGMGEKLYAENSVFAKSLEESDILVQRSLGRSLIEELYENKSDRFDDLLITHPAIVAIEVAMLEVMLASGITADYVYGNSLGEFAAGVAAGIWTKETAIEAAIEQAKSIVNSGVEGGLLAIINDSSGDMKHLLAQYNLHVASENFSGHYTVSGEGRSLDSFEKELAESGKQFVRLQVGYPFHSPLIHYGKTGFLYYNYITFPKPVKVNRFISGVYGKELTHIPDTYFWDVVTRPADFTLFVKRMEEEGSCLYLDLGPSGTCATFVKHNLSEKSTSVSHPIMTAFRREKEQLRVILNFIKNGYWDNQE